MKRENILKDLSEATKDLLDMACDLSFTEISDNCVYIISEIQDYSTNFSERIKIRIEENSLKRPRTLVDISSEIRSLYSKLYDVDLLIYKAEKDRTIIEIPYYPRSSLKSTEITLPSSIPAGLYWLNISTLEGNVSYKIVKE